MGDCLENVRNLNVVLTSYGLPHPSTMAAQVEDTTAMVPGQLSFDSFTPSNTSINHDNPDFLANPYAAASTHHLSDSHAPRAYLLRRCANAGSQTMQPARTPARTNRDDQDNIGLASPSLTSHNRKQTGPTLHPTHARRIAGDQGRRAEISKAFEDLKETLHASNGSTQVKLLKRAIEFVKSAESRIEQLEIKYRDAQKEIEQLKVSAWLAIEMFGKEAPEIVTRAVAAQQQQQSNATDPTT